MLSEFPELRPNFKILKIHHIFDLLIIDSVIIKRDFFHVYFYRFLCYIDTGSIDVFVGR